MTKENQKTISTYLNIYLFKGGDLAAIQEPEGLTAGAGHCFAYLVTYLFQRQKTNTFNKEFTKISNQFTL